MELAQRQAAQAVRDAEDKARREREQAERVAAEARLDEVRKREQAETAEAARVADKKHRAQIESEILRDIQDNNQSDEGMLNAIKAGRVRHVKIEY